jgi:hypothetical protein
VSETQDYFIFEFSLFVRFTVHLQRGFGEVGLPMFLTLFAHFDIGFFLSSSHFAPENSSIIDFNYVFWDN